MSSSCPSANGFDSGSNDRSGEVPYAAPNSIDGAPHRGERETPALRPGNRAPAPFAWQHGTQLILLDDEPGGWVMAELRFDTDLCRYVEVRRAVYEQTREAIGAVLSRSLSSGVISASALPRPVAMRKKSAQRVMPNSRTVA